VDSQTGQWNARLSVVKRFPLGASENGTEVATKMGIPGGVRGAFGAACAAWGAAAWLLSFVAIYIVRERPIATAIAFATLYACGLLIALALYYALARRMHAALFVLMVMGASLGHRGHVSTFVDLVYALGQIGIVCLFAICAAFVTRKRGHC
jgi:hypothetical protein